MKNVFTLSENLSPHKTDHIPILISTCKPDPHHVVTDWNILCELNGNDINVTIKCVTEEITNVIKYSEGSRQY